MPVLEDFFCGWRAPPYPERDHAVLFLALQILTGGRSARLYRSLVRERVPNSQQSANRGSASAMAEDEAAARTAFASNYAEMAPRLAGTSTTSTPTATPAARDRRYIEP